MYIILPLMGIILLLGLLQAYYSSKGDDIIAKKRIKTLQILSVILFFTIIIVFLSRVGK